MRAVVSQELTTGAIALDPAVTALAQVLGVAEPGAGLELVSFDCRARVRLPNGTVVEQTLGTVYEEEGDEKNEEEEVPAISDDADASRTSNLAVTQVDTTRPPTLLTPTRASGFFWPPKSTSEDFAKAVTLSKRGTSDNVRLLLETLTASAAAAAAAQERSLTQTERAVQDLVRTRRAHGAVDLSALAETVIAFFRENPNQGMSIRKVREALDAEIDVATDEPFELNDEQLRQAFHVASGQDPRLYQVTRKSWIWSDPDEPQEDEDD